VSYVSNFRSKNTGVFTIFPVNRIVLITIYNIQFFNMDECAAPLYYLYFMFSQERDRLAAEGCGCFQADLCPGVICSDLFRFLKYFFAVGHYNAAFAHDNYGEPVLPDIFYYCFWMEAELSRIDDLTHAAPARCGAI